MSAFFFTSYARLDDNPHTKLAEAVDELRERVRGLLGEASASTVGFFDITEIKTGQEWVNTIGEAVAKCRVFVCLCSNTYFNREVCGREFEFFRRRLPAATPGSGRYVFPIIWDKCVLPASLTRYHANSAGIPREYFEDGLCALRRTRRQAEYETTIELLARAIAEAAADPQLAHGNHPIPPQQFDSLPSAFDNPGDNAVRVAVLSDDDLRWSVEIGRTARSVIEEATARDQVRWRQLSYRSISAAELEAALSAREPVVLIVPKPSPVWVPRLAEVDRILVETGSSACAVLLEVEAPGPADTVSAQQRAAQLFPQSAPSLGHVATFTESSARRLIEEIRITIGRLRAQELRIGENLSKVSDPTIEAEARAAGLPIDVRPTLSGPGSAA